MEIDVREALQQKDLVFIDVRSPAEFEEASIPGAINIPLFNNREHYQLSIIFYQMGEHEARRTALEMAAPKLPELVKKITDACGDRIPLLYCKRGGMRSLSLYQVLSLAGIEACRLKKGYKAFRRHVNEHLRDYNLQVKLNVLHGLTGVGKTLVLEELDKQGFPVLDLEGLARHRGSVFGAVGFEKPRSQKDFDALLLQELDRHNDKPYLFIEGEGQRIGTVYLPHFLVNAMKQGEHFLLTAPLATRVKRILETYIQAPLSDETCRQLLHSLKSLERRLGKRKVDMLTNLIKKGDYYTVAELLCKDYYDHYYNEARPELYSFSKTIDTSDIKQAAAGIAAAIKKQHPALT